MDYDARDRIIQTTSPEGRITCVAYDNLDRATQTRQLATAGADCTIGPFTADDIVTTTEYDAMDRPAIETDPEGVKTYRWYDEYGQLAFVSDGTPSPEPPIELTVYPHAWLTGQSPSIPSTSQWWSEGSYDDAGRPTRQRFFGLADPDDPENPGFLRVAWRQYDTLGRPTASHVAAADGYVPLFSAESEDPPLPPSVASTRAYYDAQGKRWKTVDAEGRATVVAYDAFGRPETTTLPATSGYLDTVLTEYDDDGRPYRTTTTAHDGEGEAHVRVAEVEYDAWGRTRRTIGDPQGLDLITDFAYDGLGRTRTTARRWSTDSQYLPTIGDNDRVVQTVYDAAGRVFEQRARESSEPDAWAVTTLEYDDDGLVLSMKDAEQNTTEWQYDPSLGRLARMLYPSQDGKRQTVKYAAYNLRGQPTVVQYRADDDDESPRVTRTMNYDDYGRLISRTAAVENPDGMVFSGTTEQYFGYDDLGQLVHATDRSPDFGADQDVETLFWYDSAGRRIEENQRLPIDGGLVDHSVVSTFDLAGFRTSLAFPDPSYTILFESDARGRLKLIEAPNDPSSPTSGRVELVWYEWVGGQVWERGYLNGTGLRMHEPDGQGGDTLLYDGLGRPTAMKTVRDGSQTGAEPPDFRYGYDRVGNLMYEERRHEPLCASYPCGHRTRAYTTDQMGRLRAWAEGKVSDPIDPTTTDPAATPSLQTDSESWDLDLVGNWEAKAEGVGQTWTTTTFTPNALNQYASLQSSGGPVEAFSHDWLGQLREDESKGKRYTWDLFGRLTEVAVVIQGVCDDNGTPGISTDDFCQHDQSTCGGAEDCVYDALQSRYRYDALNRRVETYIPETDPATDATTLFVYDGWRAIEEIAVDTENDEIVRARYGYGVGLDEVLWMDRDVPMQGTQYDPWQGTPDGTIESRFFLHHDLLGSVVAVTDAPTDPTETKVIERFTYSAYGEVEAWHDPNWNDPTGYGSTSFSRSKVGLPFLYTGQRYEAVTGLHYYKNRIYDPVLGRFLRRDLLGYRAGPSPYSYASSNPAAITDALGLYSMSSGQSFLPRPDFMSRSYSGGITKLDSVRPVKTRSVLDRDSPTGRTFSNFCVGIGVEWRNCAEKKADYERWSRETINGSEGTLPSTGPLMDKQQIDPDTPEGCTEDECEHVVAKKNPFTNDGLPMAQTLSVFIVSPGDSIREWMGHSALFLNSNRWLSYGGTGFEKGKRGFVRAYASQGRDVTEFVLGITDQQSESVDTFLFANTNADVDDSIPFSSSMITQNCTTACGNVLEAAGIVAPNSNPGRVLFDTPGNLRSDLENGVLSQWVIDVIVYTAPPPPPHLVGFLPDPRSGMGPELSQ